MDKEGKMEKMFDPLHFRVLAPLALVFFCIFVLFLHLLGGAQKMEKKHKDTKELFQAAKRRELIQKERGGGEN